MLKVKKRVPSGRIVVHFKKKKPKVAKCAKCKKPLHGVPRLTPDEIKKLSKTEKRPERPFGGHLCPACSRKLFKERARSL